MKRIIPNLLRTAARQRPVGAALSLFLLVAAQTVAAQSATPGSRDPTLAPSLSLSAPVAVSALNARAAKTLALVGRPLLLIQRDGQRFAVLEGHLVSEGQNFGLIHIERIRETEVWFRDGKALYKISRFPGIERRAAVPDAAPR